jgi:hypothetical protein
MPEETKAQYGYYGGLDREARQEAWTSVEEDFNCTISVVEYPVDAPWGPSRWNYIVNQARLDNPEYDFYIVPDAQIPGFVSANAIIDLTEWYDTYGNGLMNTLNKTAGSYKNKLYSINKGASKNINPSLSSICFFISSKIYGNTVSCNRFFLSILLKIIPPKIDKIIVNKYSVCVNVVVTALGCKKPTPKIIADAIIRT